MKPFNTYISHGILQLVLQAVQMFVFGNSVFLVDLNS
jgi:hypothetical protein